MAVKGERRIECGGKGSGGPGLVSQEFEVPAEGWRPSEVPVFPASPAEWAGLDWWSLNTTPDPSAHGVMLVRRFVGELRRQIAAAGQDHVLAAELALACPLTDGQDRPVLEGLAASHSRLALAEGLLAQARCQESPPHLHDGRGR